MGNAISFQAIFQVNHLGLGVFQAGGGKLTFILPERTKGQEESYLAIHDGCPDAATTTILKKTN